MIVRITGILAFIDEEVAVLDRDGVGYEVHIPACATGALGEKIGQEITLHTVEYYEGSAMGGNLFPRLVGFLELEDKLFFLEFIKVKGIGYRKALRAFAHPARQIASAIESSDVKFLSSLPEIGKRTAEQLVATLRGKLGQFRFAAGVIPSRTSPIDEGARDLNDIQREALEILVQLGEKRNEAIELIKKVEVIEGDPGKIVEAVYKRKAGGR